MINEAGWGDGEREIDADTPLSFPSSFLTRKELAHNPATPPEHSATFVFDKSVELKYKWLCENLFPSKAEARKFLGYDLFADEAEVDLKNAFLILNHDAASRTMLMLLASKGYKFNKTNTKTPKYIRMSNKKITFRNDRPFSRICREVSVGVLTEILENQKK